MTVILWIFLYIVEVCFFSDADWDGASLEWANQRTQCCKPRSGKGTQTGSGTYTFLPENLEKTLSRMATRQIQLLSHENSQPHDLLVYSGGPLFDRKG